jgi:hypothetical protein
VVILIFPQVVFFFLFFRFGGRGEKVKETKGRKELCAELE